MGDQSFGDNAHKRFRAKRAHGRFPAPEQFAFLMVRGRVALNAQCDQIAWSVGVVGLPIAQMVNLQRDGSRDCFGLAFGGADCALALVAIPMQHIFPCVPEARLLALLVVGSGDGRVFDLLDVKGSRLNDPSGDGDKASDFFD